MSKFFSNGRALVIAVSAYKHITALPVEVLNDANDVVKVLTDASLCGYLPANVRVLRDAEATKTRIVEELQWLATSSTEEDTAIVYFSGHGGHVAGENSGIYLCPVDFRLDDLVSTGIEAAEVTSLLRTIRSKKLAVLLDACHAGGAGVLKVMSAKVFKAGIAEAALEQLGAGIGRVILASSTEDEYSHILPNMRNSHFTHCLLEGLRGAAHQHGDGVIRVLDLFTYVTQEVQAKGLQHPVLKTDGLQDNFPLALFMGGAKSAVSTTIRFQESPSSGDTSRLEALLSKLYPTGPLDSEIWSRARGDISTLKLGLAGKAAWHAAIRQLENGGGGHEITLGTLLAAVVEDYPKNSDLASFKN
jgi:hypothetical protein